MILTRDLETPIGCFSAGTTVQPVARTDADEWIVRLLPGWTVTLDKNAVRKTRRPTRTCITCKHETLRPAYCPDCEIIAVRMQVKKGRAA